MPRPCSPPRGRSDLNSIAEAARHVLLTAEPAQKVMASRAAARAWKQGRLDFSFDVAMPRFPARPERPQLLPPGRMPKRGRAGSDRSRIRSEEHPSELQSLMRNTYAVFCLRTQKHINTDAYKNHTII